MILTRDEKERLVLDLYNHRTPIRDIAREAGMSFRDIGRIIDKKEKEKEAIKGQVQRITQSTQAYKLFSEGKTPEEVAIALNLRQPQVTELYTEHWRLKGLYMLDQIYEEIKGDIASFVNLYRLSKSAGMGVQHVVKLLKIANNHLPAVEYNYEELQKETDVLEYDVRSAAQDFQHLTNQTGSMGNRLDLTKLDCEKEMTRLHLQQERMKQEAVVKQFKNNNEEYVKVRKTVEEKVHSVLVDRKELLGRAVLSVIESMRKDPDKYGPLIYYNDDNDNIPPSATASASSIAAYYNRQYYYPSYTYSGGQQQHCLTNDSFKQVYIDMLREQSEKLFTSLEKKLIEEAVDQHVSKTSVASSSFHVLSFDGKQ